VTRRAPANREQLSRPAVPSESPEIRRCDPSTWADDLQLQEAVAHKNPFVRSAARLLAEATVAVD
jgi:hypothetical protein